MRCRCCDVALTDYEATVKGEVSGEYLDMCRKCLKESEILYTDRPDLADGNEVEDEIEEQ